jgi:hypothetical protein
MGEKPSPSGVDFSMPRWGEKAEYSPPEGGGFERPCKLPRPEGGGIQGVHATGFNRWWLTVQPTGGFRPTGSIDERHSGSYITSDQKYIQMV